MNSSASIAPLATWALMVRKHRRCLGWHTAISWTCRHQLAILNQWIWCRLSARKLVVLRTKQILLAASFEPCWAPKFDDWIAVLFDKFPRINMHGKSSEQWNHQPAFHFSQKCSLFNLYSPICRQNSGLISICFRTYLSFQNMGQDSFKPGLLRGIFSLWTALPQIWTAQLGRLWSETSAQCVDLDNVKLGSVRISNPPAVNHTPALPKTLLTKKRGAEGRVINLVLSLQ